MARQDEGEDDLVVEAPPTSVAGIPAVVEALRQGADVVVAGRTSDPALAIAPLVHHFGWSFTDWQKLAVGAACGHLLECGSQVTGGVFWDPGFKDIPDPANIGFPIAEVTAEGGLVITKPEDTGGNFTLRPASQSDMRGGEFVIKPTLEVVYDNV